MSSAARGLEAQQHLLSRLANARGTTDELFRIVKPAAIYERPIAERHRILFYVGHLEAFDWNLLGKQVLGCKPFHETFDKLFAFGIDPVGGGLPTDQPADWPAVEEVQRYNQRLRQTIDDELARASFSDPARPLLQDGFILHVAIEHRLMHAETLAYMLHRLPIEQKIAQQQPAAPPAAQMRHGMAMVPGGIATLGMPHVKNEPFGWDNEFGAVTVSVPAFSIDRYPVTNAQYLKFMLAAGYEQKAFWGEAAWEWKTKNGIAHPQFWVRRGENWLWRTMFAEVPLPPDWPVYVSQAEAAAYAKWAGKELPSEAQFHRAAYGTPEGGERSYPWGEEAPGPFYGNFDFSRWDPVAVGSFPAGESAYGVADLLGNGWEWTSSVFMPLPGFEPFAFYPGYSANFFDGSHYVMKGGSARTARCMLRRTFRNWFQPHYPYVYAKFRCVVN